MNSVIIAGRISSISEVKKSKNDTSYILFSVAVRKDKDTTFFFDCSALKQTAELIGKYFGKGDQIIIRGELQQSTHKDSKLSRVSILVNDFDFGAKKKGADTGSEPDDLPFDC